MPLYKIFFNTSKNNCIEKLLTSGFLKIENGFNQRSLSAWP